MQIIKISPLPFETYCAGENTEGAEEARLNLEALCAIAMANGSLKQEEEEFAAHAARLKEEQEALDKALKQEIRTELLRLASLKAQQAGAVVTLAAFPARKDITKSKAQTNCATVTGNARRQGRATVNKDRASREANKRLARIFKQEADDFDLLLPLWEEDFDPACQKLLAYGCPDTGLGACVMEDAMLWFALRDTLLKA